MVTRMSIFSVLFLSTYNYAA